MQLRVIRIEGDASAELGESVVEIALLQVADAEVLAQGGIIGAEFEGAEIEGDAANGVSRFARGRGRR